MDIPKEMHTRVLEKEAASLSFLKRSWEWAISLSSTQSDTSLNISSKTTAEFGIVLTLDTPIKLPNFFHRTRTSPESLGTSFFWYTLQIHCRLQVWANLVERKKGSRSGLLVTAGIIWCRLFHCLNRLQRAGFTLTALVKSVSKKDSW